MYDRGEQERKETQWSHYSTCQCARYSHVYTDNESRNCSVKQRLHHAFIKISTDQEAFVICHFQLEMSFVLIKGYFGPNFCQQVITFAQLCLYVHRLTEQNIQSLTYSSSTTISFAQVSNRQKLHLFNLQNLVSRNQYKFVHPVCQALYVSSLLFSLAPPLQGVLLPFLPFFMFKKDSS